MRSQTDVEGRMEIKLYRRAASTGLTVGTSQTINSRSDCSQVGVVGQKTNDGGKKADSRWSASTMLMHALT
jgi:hypothetical protein